MATNKKKRIMVLNEEGAAAPMALHSTASPPDLVGALKTGQASAVVANEESNIAATSTPGSAMSVALTLNSAVISNNQPENLPPESTRRGIKVMLDSNNMWNEFFRCKTEMILTKQGRRMFPYCRFRISGLDPFQKYNLLMDINPMDNKRYKWTGQNWQTSGKAEAHMLRRIFIHPDSPSSGHQWMQNPVSFYKLKLTDNTMDQEGNVILHPMHRYLPHLHVVSAEMSTEDIQLNGRDVITFTFPQTEFFAVTAYQNLRMSQFKADFNPFASGPSWALKLKTSPSNDSKKNETSSPNELKPVKGLNGLKSLMAAKHSSKDTSAVDKGLPSADAQNVMLADSETRSPSALKPVKGLSGLKALMGMVAKGKVVEVAVNYNLSQIPDTLSKTLKNVGTQDNGNTIDSEKDLLSSSQSQEPVKTPVSINDHSADEVESSQKASQSSSVSSEAKRTGSDEQQLGKAKPHKRPDPVPLPLLALYLQRLKSKSRPVRTKPKSPLPSTSSPSSAVPTTDPTGPAMVPTGYAVLPSSDSVVRATDTTGQTTDYAGVPTNISVPNTAFLVPATDSLLPEPDPVLLTTDQSLLVPEPTLSITLSSPTPPLMLPFPDPLLPAPDSLIPAAALSSPAQELPSPVPVTLNLAADLLSLTSDHPSNAPALSSTPSVATLKPECTPSLLSPGPSLGGFEPSSPASLPDLEPPLPSPDQLKLVPAPSLLVPASSFPALEQLPAPNLFVLSSDLSSHASLLALPAPDPFLTTSFIPLLPSAHLNPLPFEAASFSSTSHPGSLALDPGLSSPPLDPLSPFSSLGPDPLSPTPSLADLTHFFSISDELEMTEDFPSSELAPVPCPHVPTLITPSVPVSSTLPVGSSQPTKSIKPQRYKKRSRTGVKSAKGDPLPVIGGPTDVAMQPNLEEVEEQLFVSFTSKEALEVHLGEPAFRETTTAQPEKTPEAKENGTENNNLIHLVPKIAGFEKVLLDDLKVMKHRQVIHPVLQEVGLKMSLLDPTLVIDLQYLGVRLPLPPPMLCPGPSGSVPFVSRTGKTTDFTQIKGWRDKIVPSDSSASSNSDVVPKNLSAFCSDMLDEYLANEGKLIDERAASFIQTTVVTPVTYQLPTKSTSYVRTLDSVLKKQAPAPSTTFVPPSKKNRLPLASKGPKKSEKSEKRQQKQRSKPEVEEPPPPDLAPVEGDSEPESAAAETRVVVPGLTKALLRQRDLEDGVVWEGKHRTCITEDRATVALTSLFTSTNPTAPIKIVKRRAPPCLNAFCRLGCVCASLAQDRRITHCGKIECIFGCSCLRQKVVVLKNLKGPDSSASEEGPSKKSKKRKRMRMAYTLREAETVSEPARRVRTLWKQTDGEMDPEPLLAPTPVYLPWLPLQEESSAVVRLRRVPSRKSEKSSSHGPQYTEPSKRLEIMSECKWRSLADRNLVLRIVCEHMAQDHLTNPFWVKGYLIKPMSQTLRNDGESCSIHYKVHISQEVEEGQSVEKKQREQENKPVGNKKGLKWKGLPFLTGISPAGLLTANLKQTDISDKELVNGRSYPHAKLQLGMMGAMHPANRLAAYLTGKLRRPTGPETSMATSVSSQHPPSESPEDTRSSTGQPAQLTATPTTSLTIVTTSTSPSSGVVTSPPMLVLPDTGTSNAVRRSCPPTSQTPTPLIPLTPLAAGRRMVLQPVRSASGTTLYRNPNGQLIQLVPLSQLQALNPNLVMRNKGECLTVDAINAKALLLFSPSSNTGLLSLSTGKTEELILRKLQDISTKQKNMDVMFKGKRRGASSAPSSSVLPNKAISPSSTLQPKPKSLAPGLKLKVVPTPVPRSIPPQPAPQQPKTSPIISPPSRKPPSTCRSPGERTRPNILSRRKPQPPLGKSPLPLTLLLSSSTKWARLTADLETELPCDEIKHCQSFGFVFLPPQQIPHLFMLGFSLLKCCLYGLEDREVLEKQLDHSGDCVKINDADRNSDEEDEDNEEGDVEDESLTSLLNEIVFLNQQMTTDNISPSGLPVVTHKPPTEPGEVGTDRSSPPPPPQAEKEIIRDGDDERSLSPLFLRLDEDLLGLKERQGQDEASKGPGLPVPQAEDLKVGSGSNEKPSETGSAPAPIVNGHSPQGPACTAKGHGVLQKALTPPPLLQMKVGVAKVQESNDKQGDALAPPPLLQMRPMPRLAPLGLKNNPQT
uniref:T-box domain-containing protein n=1 Tax=Hucho hucho TaxID=62062 RepID=A0A4W5PGT4_9TELE